ncbi:14 kDa proline-rich protein DC2.15-like [Cynara cardunculus var. scolymus]|uniref:Bifunctional inhibitor/plant lipid transfer protein/seed storage helical domain-containing protein n=1 Tax=Cynara cardunculus var. scolymus TaxID=59895 RepID=A0A118JTN4_CYNCS|nr:14 kDa proline-rich protein DC2.15-like [Cynara cardunculus var. scolymus]KVH90159.1 hypothetical protein Ccrd_007837 [Cynara cardunculus var. scolymus]
MASMSNASVVLFLALHYLFFVMVSGCATYTSLTPKQSPNSNPTATPIPTPTPTPTPTLTRATSCPRDALKLGVCAKLLGGLVNAEVGSPPVKPCCSLIQGLADLEAAACLCTAIKANVLGININVPVSFSLLLGVCGNQVSGSFQCG